MQCKLYHVLSGLSYTTYAKARSSFAFMVSALALRDLQRDEVLHERI